MRKVLIMSFVLMFTLMFGFANVNAEEGDNNSSDTNYIIIFEKNETSVTVNTATSTYSLSTSEKVNVGDTINLEAKLCPFSKFVIDNSAKTATILKSDCTDGTFTWTSSDSNVASISEGVLTIKGYGSTTVTATSSETGSGSITYTFAEKANSANTNTKSDSDTSTGTSSESDVINGDEPDEDDGKLVPKKSVSKTEKLVGKQTASNPSTGVKESIVYIVPALLVLGSGIVLKKHSLS